MKKNFLSSNAEVWSQPNCPACVEAKNLLNLKGIPFQERLLGINTGYTKKDLLDRVPDARSVPQIFLNGKYVGGLLELKRVLLDDNS